MRKIKRFSLILLIGLLVNFSSCESYGGANVKVCGNSSIYHTTNTCGSLKICKSDIKSIPLDKAKSLGKRKCKKCN